MDEKEDADMPDKISKEKRSEIMSKIQGKDTKPELLVRNYLYHHGYRYRKNYNKLPGSPDIYLQKYNTAIFINGCFWHGHEGCKYFNIPKSNTKFGNVILFMTSKVLCQSLNII